MNFWPLPFSQKPESSTFIISFIEKQSCASITSISSCFNLHSSNACFAAAFTLAISVIEARSCKASVSEPWPLPNTHTGFSNFLAIFSEAIITAAAPSVMGEQSSKRSGSATNEDILTSSILTFIRNCAFSFFSPFSWLVTGTKDSSSLLNP